MKASRAGDSAPLVLFAMCWASDWDTDGREVTISKNQLAERCKRSKRTIRNALQALREEGSVEVISGGKGGGYGGSVAPRYRLKVAQLGVQRTTTRGATNASRGATNDPLSIESIDSMSRRGSGGGARQWRGRQAEKKGAGGNRRALTQEQKEKTKRRNLAEKLAGDYGGGKRLIAAWDAGEIPEGQPWP